MKWLKLHHDILGDIKLRRFTAQEKWAWIVLLILASEGSDRGFISAQNDDIADACEFNTTQDWLYFRDKLIGKGMLEINADGDLEIVNWLPRQYDKPSDYPEQVAERKRNQRAKEKDEMSRPVTPMSLDVTEQLEDVTLESRDVTPCHAQIRLDQIRLEENRSDQIREEEIKEDLAIAKTTPVIKNSGLEIFQEIYNQEKPQLWANCDKLTASRIKKLKALIKEFGDRTIEIWTDALTYCRSDTWCNTRNLDFDYLFTKDKIAGLAEKSKSVPSNKSNGMAQEFNRITNLFEERNARSTNIYG